MATETRRLAIRATRVFGSMAFVVVALYFLYLAAFYSWASWGPPASDPTYLAELSYRYAGLSAVSAVLAFWVPFALRPTRTSNSTRGVRVVALLLAATAVSLVTTGRPFALLTAIIAAISAALLWARQRSSTLCLAMLAASTFMQLLPTPTVPKLLGCSALAAMCALLAVYTNQALATAQLPNAADGASRRR